MNKPKISFLVPGFSKCGTTTLCSLLDQHPDIFIPEIKEPMFFNKRNYNHLWDQYSAYFAPSKPGQLLGEGTTFYSTKNDEEFVRAQIKQHYPNLKMIFIARDPISRIESSFREFHHSGPRFGVLPELNLKGALEQLPAIIDDTLYWSRLNAYKTHFPEGSIHVMFLEDLKLNPQAELEKCFQFLGVDPCFKLTTQDQKLNLGETKLHDSMLFRKLRSTPLIGPWLAKYPIHTQDKVATRLCLRQRFKAPIIWDRETSRWLFEKFGNEMDQFLADNGKPQDFWEKLQTMKNQHVGSNE